MIELPRDSKGKEIPLDADALYDKNGERMAIYAWEYMPKLKYSKWRVRFLFDDSGVKYYPDEYFLTPPDSWEKLLDELDNAASKTYCGTCTYFGKNPTDCDTCAIGDISACDSAAMRDIASRIRKLRGED